MDLVGRWWNGRWGRRTRRDVWLTREVRWHVRAREGTADSGRELKWDFADEAAARHMVERLIRSDPAVRWRDITDLYDGT